MPRTTMLAGAPAFTSFTKSDLTITTWLPAFSTFLQNQVYNDSSTVSHITPLLATIATTQPDLPAWRSVSLARLHLPTGFSQRGWLDEALGLSSPVERAPDQHEHRAQPSQEQVSEQQDSDDDSPTRRLSTFKKPLPKALPGRGSEEFAKQKEVLLSQYLERSFALHDAIHSSQVIPADESTLLEVDDRAVDQTSAHPRAVQDEDEHEEDSEIEATFFTSTSTQEPLASQTNDVTFTSTYPGGTAPDSTIDSISTTSDSSSTFSSTIRPLSNRKSVATRRSTSRQPPSAPHLLPLSSLPTPSHLHAIHPQTMTVDLIVGIISASSLRIVTVRRTGRQVGVLELLVGDETRAGFGVTFWVDVTQEESQGQQSHVTVREIKDELCEMLEALRKGDVVLLRNVALSEFQKVVRGNSLGRTRRGGGGRGGNATSVALLWRAGWMRDVIGDGQGDAAEAVYDSDDLDGVEGKSVVGSTVGRSTVVTEKTKKVREWTRRFIPAVTAGTTPTKRREKRGRADMGDGTRGKRTRGTIGEDDSLMSRAGGAFGMMDELPPDDSLMPDS